MKHNKKKNILFLYEALFQKLAKLTLLKSDKISTILKIIKENFHINSELYKSLQVFQSIVDSEIEILPKVLEECKSVKINSEKLEKERLKLIEQINKFDNSIYDVFVENYKELATIYQILNTKNLKEKVKLQESLKNFKEVKESANLKSVDSLTISKFLERYNKEYSEKLSENQRNLVREYIFSFIDNQLSLKSFLNEEIKNLKDSINENIEKSQEIKKDNLMIGKFQEVLKILEGYKVEKPSRSMIVKILKIQDLTKELKHEN